mgnify:FL=1
MFKQILKVLLYGFAAFVLLSVSISLLMPSDNEASSQGLPDSSVNVEAPTDSGVASDVPSQDSNAEQGDNGSNETVGQANARQTAERYLDFSAFSRSGLIEQLEFEGYSTQDATYAVDAVGADWNEQAAKKAESYLASSSFSRQGLIDQLVFEGFSQAEAEYGVTQVGY